MTNVQKREEITRFLVNLYDTLDPTGSNTAKFLATTKNKSDSQFIALFTAIVNDPSKHLYVEFEAFENEPDYETIEKAAYDIVGDEYCHLWDYIVMPHVSPDQDNPYVTTNKIFTGYINLRRVQQLVNTKNHIPTHNDKRDPRTGQVTLESKAARVSDTEQFAMICQGMPNLLKEMFGPRGGDPVMREQLEFQVATSGHATLGEMEDSKFNKIALNTANVMFTAAGLETDMVTSNGVLPRTLLDYDKEAKVLKRQK